MRQKFSIFLFVIFLTACADNKDPHPSAPAAPTTQYQLAQVEKEPVNQQLRLPAQLAAYEEVSIFPKVNGYVKSVLVDIGSQVRKGQVLMILDAPELEQAVAQAKEKYARSKSDFTIDKDNYERLKEASQTPGAISPLDLSTSKGKMEADSALSNAEKANWQMQETMLGYLTVVAPFDGVITERNVHPGALVSAEAKDSRPMLELKQVSHLRLQVDVPEDYASALKVHDTVSFNVSSIPGKRFIGQISRNSMNISRQFRTQRVELDVYNKEGLMSPGMYADILLDARGNPNGWSVPQTALVISTERKYVLVVR
ncbi:MAG TPA: efflux RND transporter periplasmic adaptor subunit, partial [Puia sp.]|nr:efflux RND transporter periplasmic adaptor subunit [Puia sp.]